MAARLLGKLRPGLVKGTCATVLAKPQQCLAEEPDWVVGGRYELLHEATLRGPSSESETVVGRLPAKRMVLLLALHRTSVRGSTDHVRTDEEVLGFLADTSRAGWLFGWAQLSGPDTDQPGGPIARRQRCRGSWEVGGRYRVTGNLAIREGIELDSQEVRETRRGEEVLVLSLGLYMVASSQEAGEPRLRAEVRADSGEVGWLTVELPGGSPLLDPQNLYGPEAMHTRPLAFRARHGRTRVSALEHSGQGPSHRESWEVGGQYRALSALTLRQESELDSLPLGSVRAGDLLRVQDVTEIWLRGQPRNEVRLRVSAAGDGSPSVVGWVSCTRKSGELLVDVRDHLEYLHVTGEDPPPPVGSHLTLPAPHPEEVELGDCEDGAGRQDSCGGATSCGGSDADRFSQRSSATSGAEALGGCLACGGAGCSLCQGRAAEAAPECLARGGAGCTAHGPGAVPSEQAAGAPGGLAGAGAPASAAEATPVPWDRAGGLPVEEFGGASPSALLGRAWESQVDRLPAAASPGRLPVEDFGGASPSSPLDRAWKAQSDKLPAAAAPGRAAEEHAQGGGSLPRGRAPQPSFRPERPEVDEWRPLDDPRTELDAPGQDWPLECHGGGLFGWTEPFLSCGGSRIIRCTALEGQPLCGRPFAPQSLSDKAQQLLRAPARGELLV